MKITQSLFVASALALSFGATAVNAQNVGIGVTNPASKRTVDGNPAIDAEKTVVRAEARPGEVHPVALNQ